VVFHSGDLGEGLGEESFGKVMIGCFCVCEV
jgi:hypothetical protein